MYTIIKLVIIEFTYCDDYNLFTNNNYITLVIKFNYQLLKLLNYSNFKTCEGSCENFLRSIMKILYLVEKKSGNNDYNSEKPALHAHKYIYLECIQM